MRATLGWSMLVVLGACDGLIISPAVDPGPSPGGVDAGPVVVRCGGEQFCLGTAALPRLTGVEFAQTVSLTFGADAGAVALLGLPADGRAGPFASNDGSPVNDDMVAQYQQVAETVAAVVAQNAPAVLGCAVAAPSDACVTAFVDRVARSLFRGPLTDDERTVYFTLFRTIQARGTAVDAVRVVTSALLQSPRFLYHVRIGTPVVGSKLAGDGDVARLTSVELAERLAFFLLGAPPDPTLLAAAANGDLDTVAGLKAQARRLLADPRADLGLGQFHTQWLGVDDLPVRSFAPQTYPGVQDLRSSLFEETRAFSAYVIRQGDARLETLLTAGWTVAPTALRPFYGLTAATGATGRLDLPAGERSGLLTQAGFLATHTHDPSTQAVHRGKAIRELLLCQSIPPPPANIDPRINADPALSPRQRLEAKTSPSSCQGCHQLMNPAGFLFERFDVSGRSRTRVDDVATGTTFAIDATGSLPQSDVAGPLDGAPSLGAALSKSEAVQKCVARQWFRYALGRHEAGDADERSLAEAYQGYVSSGRNLRELLVSIVASDAFRYRRSAP